MNKLTTDKKYSLILSAYVPTNSVEQNMIDTERMFDALEHRIHVHAIRAVGVYNAKAKQSFVVHTNSANTMAEVRRLALEVYYQDCVLVSHNRRKEIKLHYVDCENEFVGTHFVHSPVKFKQEPSYTILNGANYYTVR